MGRSELPTVAKALVDTQAGLDDLEKTIVYYWPTSYPPSCHPATGDDRGWSRSRIYPDEIGCIEALTELNGVRGIFYTKGFGLQSRIRSQRTSKYQQLHN
jgi:hypothetical protein